MPTTAEIEKRVPLQTAIASIALYKQVMTNLYSKNELGEYHLFTNRENVPRAFAIRHADLLQVLGFEPEMNFPEAQHFRIYFGIDNDPTLPSMGFKYYLVPMKVNQLDEGSDDIQRGDIIVDGVVIPNQEYVYDFSFPCPNTCDTTSRLFTAGDPPIA